MYIHSRNTNNRNINSIHFIINIATINYLLVMFFPIYERISITILTILSNLLLFFLFLFINKIKYWIIIPAIILCVLEFLWAAMNNANLLIEGYDLILWLMPIFLINHYIKKPYAMKILIFIVLFSIAITSITSYVGLLNDPEASRFLATVASPDNPYFISLNWKNIGGFTLIYMIVISIPTIVLMYKAKVIKISIFLILLIPMVLFIVESQYTLAILLTIPALSTLIIPKSKSISFRNIFIISVILFLIILPVLSDLLIILANSISSVSVYERLYYLSNMLSGNIDMNSPANIRVELYMKSIDAIYKYNIIGGWLSGKNDIYSGHSFVLDTVAKYGIIGLSLLILLYKSVYKEYYKRYRNSLGYNYLMVSFLISLLISVVNPFDSLFFIIFLNPAVLIYLYNKSTVQENYRVPEREVQNYERK